MCQVNFDFTYFVKIKNYSFDKYFNYRVQVNTVPMSYQVGYVEVVVPPDILVEESSSDVIASEGSNVTLRCKAKGYPLPTIKWMREDRMAIPVHDLQQNRYTGKFVLISLNTFCYGPWIYSSNVFHCFCQFKQIS